MLNNSSLIAFVGSSTKNQYNPKRVQLYDAGNSQIICELQYESPIRNIFFGNNAFVILTEKKVDLFDLIEMKLLKSFDCVKNKNGIGSCVGDIICFQTENIGEIIIINLVEFSVQTIQAHNNPIECIQISENSKLVATTSKVY
jgi:hypothetical protein